MYFWKVFLWENGKKSTDYTDYTVAPIFIEDKLDETLDSGEIILKNMPIATKNAFPPKTKFRIYRYSTSDYSDIPKKWDFVVEHDDVEEYVGCPSICTHRINLTEASVFAQGLHCDNIALTYELQDVNLNYRTTSADDGVLSVENVGQSATSYDFLYGYAEKNGVEIEGRSGKGFIVGDYVHLSGYTKDEPDKTTFKSTFSYYWKNLDSLGKLNSNLSGEKKTIRFSVPKLVAATGTGASWEDVAELPVRVDVSYVKYKQRAVQNSDGMYVPDDERYPNSKSEIDKGSILRRVIYPATNSSFVEIEGRTRKGKNGNSIYILVPNQNFWSSDDQWVRQWVEDMKWINQPEDEYFIDDFKLPSVIPLSMVGTTDDEISFDTWAISDEEAIFRDENGDLYMTWYEYDIIVREAVYSIWEDLKRDESDWSDFASGIDESYRTNPKQSPYLLISQQYESTNWVYGNSYNFGSNYNYSERSEIQSNDDSNIYVSAKIVASGKIAEVNGGAFLAKSKKYSCYDMLRKALLTVDTHVINNSETGLADLWNKYPIKVRDDWVSRLQSAQMHETVFEQKNLWEILLQIGYYLHAIPYIEFSDDGTDRFLLSFRQLGATKEKEDKSRKITVFNSRNLSDYFAEYDSYVTNLFSPQNEVDEWLVAKTSDSTYIISNDTAEIKTSRPILEILEFYITYGDKTVPALNYIFEESVYQVLTSDNPERIYPAKGNALYYSLGTNVIKGLSYVPPQKNSGTYVQALQEICRRLFGISAPEDLKYKDLSFHVKYRTQDDLRISQVRPDVQNFLKNSAFEKYPHHEQYYGQQDKIVDSERFSANLFGQLIRVGNTEYQRQEYATGENEKESGDLVMIDGEPYYVTATENEYYPDAILQKVTYSKNFNQLSKIVTIPSEPRFYEVSERSKIRREVRMLDFFELTTTEPLGECTNPRFLSSTKWKAFLRHTIFNDGEYTFPNFAYTKFKSDYRRDHVTSEGLTLSPEKLFPSSDVIRQGENSVKPADSKDNSECIVSLLHYPLHDGIVFEWDMEDNFKSGDYIDVDNPNTKDSDYVVQQSHRYVDVMGRADLFTFRLFNKTNWTQEQIKRMPNVAYIPDESMSDVYLPSPYLIGLDKDNREAISFNYQISLLHRSTEADSEDFFTFPNLFGQKESPLKMCFLRKPQSLFNENLNMSPADILAENITFSIANDEEHNAIKLTITKPDGVSIEEVKSIALYTQATEGGVMVAYIIKNVGRLPVEERLQPWWIIPVFCD